MADSLTGLGSNTTIFLVEPDWKSAISNEFELSSQILGYPGTVQSLLTFASKVPKIIEFKLMNLDKSTECELIEFFVARKGRFSPFWLLGHTSEFKLSQTIPAASPVLYVEDNGFVNKFKEYERIYLDMKNGDLITRQITSVVAGPAVNEITLQLDTVTDRELSNDDFHKFGMLYYVRLNKDLLDLPHESKSISSTSISFQELVNEYPT